MGPAGAGRARTITARAPAVDAGIRAIPVPTRLRIEANPLRLRLTWAETRAADELHVAYHVYRRLGTGREERLTEMPLVRLDARVPFFEDREVQQGATYRYTVRAVDLAGREGAPSVAESLTVRDRSAPEQPREVVAVREIGQVRVSWAPSTSPDVAGYFVERSPGLNKRYIRLTARALARDSLVYVDSTVPLRQQHFWRIIAVDSAGNASTPSSGATGLAEDNVPPPPPTGVTARAVQRRLVISWTASNARDLRGYHIYRGDDSTRMVRLTRVPFVGRTYVDSTTDGRGLRPGGGYTVRVSAVDSTLNESAPVTVRVLVPDDEAPEPPSGVAVRDEQGRYMEITWSASPSPDVRWYTVTRRDSATVRTTSGRAADSVLIARVDGRTGSPWSLRDTLPKTHGRTYLYAITPTDTAGNVGKPAIAKMDFAEKVPPPSVRFAAATLLPQRAGVRVRWERVVDRELVGYHVYRSKIPTGNFERRTSRPVTVLEFTDAGADGTWWYVVRAVDASGNESSASRPVRGLP
jgi:fibronectin type 3 domain-containing protein